MLGSQVCATPPYHPALYFSAVLVDVCIQSSFPGDTHCIDHDFPPHVTSITTSFPKERKQVKISIQGPGRAHSSPTHPTPVPQELTLQDTMTLQPLPQHATSPRLFPPVILLAAWPDCGASTHTSPSVWHTQAPTPPSVHTHMYSPSSRYPKGSDSQVATWEHPEHAGAMPMYPSPLLSMIAH